jgi:plasmid stabilization system protein ParE
MTYIVEFAERAARDLEILYIEKSAAELHAAARWYNGLEQALDALALFPNRYPPAPEAPRAKRKLRHLLYGKKPHVYRVIDEYKLAAQGDIALAITSNQTQVN